MRITKIVLFFFFSGVFAPTSSFSAALPHNTTYTVQPNPAPYRLSVRALWKAVKKKKAIDLALVIVGGIFILLAIFAFILVASIARSARNTATPTSGVGNEGSALASVVLLTGGLLSLISGAILLLIGIKTPQPKSEIEKVEKIEKTKEEKQKSKQKILKVLGIIVLVFALKMLLSFGV